ncbi:MAG: HD domain-containing protein [Saprospiraceae bacterium]|nr:HD domain-containing protein [Saprospiraceae bacterium]
MAQVKIFNDPVYGFITVPSGILLDLIEHPYFQRLQRIKQLGLSHYVYPGAVHSRFHHALGAYHLMTMALNHLRLKGVDIAEEEFRAAQIAILLHDIGHGPFSHVLENTILPVHHEQLTALLMEQLNQDSGGKLDLAIRIFNNQYDRPFLHQLISSQLDTDRLDYLTRDSFFTGVAEGVIGYDRLILMMDVRDHSLILEEKALYSIEKFLTSRKIMYLQVYMHKTALAAECMLNLFLNRLKEQRAFSGLSHSMTYFLDKSHQSEWDPKEFLPQFVMTDDVDIWALLKEYRHSEDPVLKHLAQGLTNRKLFKIQIKDEPFDEINEGRFLDAAVPEELVRLLNHETFHFEISPYELGEPEIVIQSKTGMLKPFSQYKDMEHLTQKLSRHYRIIAR